MLIVMKIEIIQNAYMQNKLKNGIHVIICNNEIKKTFVIAS